MLCLGDHGYQNSNVIRIDLMLSTSKLYRISLESMKPFQAVRIITGH